MTAIKLRSFGGMAPLLQSSKLLDVQASLSVNGRSDSGGLRSVPGPEYIEEVDRDIGVTIRSVIKYANNGVSDDYLLSTNYRQYVTDFIPNSTENFLFYSEYTATTPPTLLPVKIRTFDSEYDLGLPRPAAPTATIDDAGDMTDLTQVRNQSYIVAVVDAFGFEGPPSLPSNSVEVGEGAIVDVDLSGSSISGNYNLGAGALLRIYRSNTSSTGEAVYQYATDVLYGTASWEDDLDPADLQEIVISQNWVAPPPLASLVLYPGNILCGHNGNTVYFSQPNAPHAWPYSRSIDTKIVGLVVIQSGLLVLTKGRPVLFTGDDPANIVEVKIETYEPCIAQFSIVDMGDYALYASPNGIIMAQGAEVRRITAPLLDKNTWAGYSTCGEHGYGVNAVRHRGHYLLTNQNTTKAVDYLPAEDGGILREITEPMLVAAATPNFIQDIPQAWYHNPESDDAMFAVDATVGSTGYSRLFTYEDQGSANSRDVTWMREYLFPDPVCLYAVRVRKIGDDEAITLTLTAPATGDSYVFENLAGDAKLPVHIKADRWQVRLDFAGELESFTLADNMGELDE